MAEVTWTEGRHGAREFQFEGSVRRVTGALWMAQDAAPGTPMVLFGHGASGDRYQAPIPHLARRFVEDAGFCALAVDGPVHGLRQQGPGGRAALFEEMKRSGFIDDMVIDWQDALIVVREQCGAGLGKLAYFGLSMGTLFGLPLLASGEAFVTSVIGLCGTTGAAARQADRLLAAAGRVDHPVLFLMQLEDELFPREGYLALFDALACDDKRLHANPGLHPQIPAEEIDCAYDFISARLCGTVTRRIVNPLAE